MSGEWPGDERLGEVETSDNHQNDWKPKTVITETKLEGSKHPNVEVVIESKPEI